MSSPTAPGELEPLRKFCRKGRLFDVRQWARFGKPVALKVAGPFLKHVVGEAQKWLDEKDAAIAPGLAAK